jgi:hypothetical protein
VSDLQREYRTRSKLEDLLPTAQVTQVSWAGLEDTSAPLELSYSVEIPGFAQVLDTRMLVRSVLLPVRNRLKAWKRDSAVYLRHAYSEIQEVKIVPPQGFEVEFLPAPQNHEDVVGSYTLETSREGGAVRVRREFSVDGVIFRSSFERSALKQHVDSVEALDRLQLVLRQP